MVEIAVVVKVLAAEITGLTLSLPVVVLKTIVLAFPIGIIRKSVILAFSTSARVIPTVGPVAIVATVPIPPPPLPLR